MSFPQPFPQPIPFSSSASSNSSARGASDFTPLLINDGGATTLGLPAVTANSAVFLDFDGTLVDIASRPDAIEVPTDLSVLLAMLSKLLGGAVAMVSGRTLAELDRYLAPLELPSAAEHGAHCRMPNGGLVWSSAPELQETVRRVTLLASQHVGLQAELKSASVALHYRHAPQLQEVCMRCMKDIADSTPGIELLHGKYVLEIKPEGVSKGIAIRAFMQQAPFAGRMPVFAGDDATDEVGFAAVYRMGGECLKVGSGNTLARLRCASPDAVRSWLLDSCATLQADSRTAALGSRAGTLG